MSIWSISLMRQPLSSSEDGGSPGERGHSETLTLSDFIYFTYNSLLESGWRMSEIDQMDMLGLLRVRTWDAQRKKKKKEPKRAFIDEVWPKIK